MSEGLVTQISLGDRYTCAVLSTGNVKCWGEGSSGQLGYGDTTDKNGPQGNINVGGSVVKISASWSHTCAVLSSGNLRCWGNNYLGQLGYGDYTNRYSPGGEIFDLAPDVSFGGQPATNVVVVSGTRLTATTPAHPAGLVDVAVTNGDGQVYTLNNSYTYTSSTIQNSNISALVCTPSSTEVNSTTNCTITTDSDLSYLNGSVNVRIGNTGTVVNCPVTGSGTTLTCNNIPVGSTAGTFISQYNASGSGSVYNNGNNVVVASEPFNYTQTLNASGFSWVDATDGTNTGLFADDGTVSAALPFNFTFYGNSYSSIDISSNGLISFGGPNSAYANVSLPSGNSSAGNIIAPYWGDLYNGGGQGNIYTKTIGTPGNQTFVIEWNQVQKYGAGGTLTFQVLLNQDGTIVLQYLDMSDFGSGATIGIADSTGTVARQATYNSDILTNNYRITYNMVGSSGSGSGGGNGSGNNTPSTCTPNTTSSNIPGQTSVDLCVSSGALSLYAGDSNKNNDICTGADITAGAVVDTTISGQSATSVTCSVAENSIALNGVTVASKRQFATATIDDIIFEDLRGLNTANYTVTATISNFIDPQDSNKNISLGSNPDSQENETDQDKPTLAGDANKIFGVLDPSGGQVTALRSATTIADGITNYSRGSRTTLIDNVTQVTLLSTTSAVKPGRIALDGVLFKLRIPSLLLAGNFQGTIVETVI